MRFINMSSLQSFSRFFWAGLRQHGQTGGLVPSQRFLIAKMIAPVPEDYQGRIIELGAGTGALTVRLAERCHHARVLACEVNPALARINRARLAEAGIRRRVEVVVDSAEHVLAAFRQRRCRRVRFVISGIPLGNMPAPRIRVLIAAIWRVLAPGGMYIQFQHSLLDVRKVRAAFPKLRIGPVWLNVPPAIVYYATR
jgi:phospholipid N-methyltransferase